MNKAVLALTTLAAMAAAPLALAQEPTSDPSPDPHGASTTIPATPPPSGQPRAAQAPPAQMTPPAQTPTPALPPVPSSVTVITAAEVVPMPMTPVHREADTVTLNQTLRPNRPLLLSGGTMLLGAYATTAALTATRMFHHPDKTMYIPVAGPWMHLKDIRENPRDTALIIGSGVVQGVGIGLVAASLIIPEKVPAATIQAGGVRMNVTATSFGRGSAGIGAVGQF